MAGGSAFESTLHFASRSMCVEFESFSPSAAVNATISSERPASWSKTSDGHPATCGILSVAKDRLRCLEYT